MNIPVLVAHRGLAGHYPENTLVGAEAALKAGACFVEIDIQMTSDQVPVLLHDVNLARTTGTNALVCELPYRQICQFDAGESDRFGSKYQGTAIPTLVEFVKLLQKWPKATAFIEIKIESLEIFNTKTVVQNIMDIIKPLISNCIPISYDIDAVRYARQLGAPAIGWVMDSWDDESRKSAEALNPEYLFCNYQKIPESDNKPWQGPWKWVVYEVREAEHALSLASRGIDMIETMFISDLFKNPQLKSKGCLE